MTDPSNGQDPSMEDILASIRRIIDEDDRKATGAAAMPPAGPGEEDEDVLELTDEIDEPDDEGPPEPAEADIGGEIWAADDEAPTATGDAGQPETGATWDPVAEDVAEPAEPEVSDAPGTPRFQENSMNASGNDRLVSEAALSSAAAALGNLARASERDPLAGVPQGRPVEDLVMELLRPMLREWLDQHLPTIVERVVEREVRYLSRRMGSDDGA